MKVTKTSEAATKALSILAVSGALYVPELTGALKTQYRRDVVERALRQVVSGGQAILGAEQCRGNSKPLIAAL